ncbi:MAG: hypothetical protein OFPII_03190 [Osedax symbiont Rs1]|nr:MAG: hypothetical protein OFPII_03190 [Osedax symbiont Rs1]
MEDNIPIAFSTEQCTKKILITHHFQLWLALAPPSLVLVIGLAENAFVK